MDKDTYMFSKTAVENQYTKLYDKPRMAAGGAKAGEAVLTSFTN